jgi:hypothetical protein
MSWLTVLVLSSLRSLGGSILSSLGPVGVIAMLAGGVLLVAVPLGLIRFASRPRGMVMAAAVLAGGLAMMGFAPKPAEPPSAEREFKAKEVAKPVTTTPQKAEDVAELTVMGDLPLQPALPIMPVAAMAPAIVPPVAMLGGASHHVAASSEHAAATHTATHNNSAVAAAKSPTASAHAHATGSNVTKSAHAIGKTPASPAATTPASTAKPQPDSARAGKAKIAKPLLGSTGNGGSVAANTTDRPVPKSARMQGKTKGRSGAASNLTGGMTGMGGMPSGNARRQATGRGTASGTGGQPAISRAMSNRIAEAELNGFMGRMFGNEPGGMYPHDGQAGGVGSHPRGGQHSGGMHPRGGMQPGGAGYPGQGLPHRGGHR